jgi:hypothetical protein
MEGIMTEKENFLKVIRGEIPEWLPRYGTFPNPLSGCNASALAAPSFYGERRNPDGSGFDIWGVEYTPTDSTGGNPLPTPDRFILKDITKWRDVIKAPDISHIDWEKMSAQDLKKINRDEVVVEMGTHVGYFQQLMNFMGFTEGLTAMFEEPDEVFALYSYMADFYDEVARKTAEYYKPDIFSITDDTATSINPFISTNMYRELVKPFHARLGKVAQEFNLPVNMHNCGRCEDFIEDWFDFGVCMWNPAQVMNDLVGIKKKYGDRLTLIGCWDSSGPPGWPGASEELVRSEVRKCIDTFAPGGRFCFWGSVYGPTGDEEVERRAGWLTDEYKNYGRPWYKNHAQ